MLIGLLVGSVYCTIPAVLARVPSLRGALAAYGRRAYFASFPRGDCSSPRRFAIGWPFRHLHLYDSKVPWVMGVMFIVAGFSIYRLGVAWVSTAPKISGLAELEPGQHDQKLVVTGIRTQVRHPIYLGHLCEVFGWTVGTGSIALCGLLVFAVITGAIMIRKEDAELEARFGDLYRQYRDSVPALLPKFPI